MYLHNYITRCLLVTFTACIFMPQNFTQKLKASDVFQVCKTSDTDYNQCIIQSLNALRPALIKGIPKLKIPSVEPMQVEKIVISQGTGAVSIDSTFTNQKIYGITNYTLKSMRADPEKFKIEFDVFLPELYVVGDYAINGKVLVLPISGHGFGTSNYTDVNGNAKLTGHPETRNGKKYFKLDDFNFDIHVKNGKIHMDNLFNGNKQLGDTMNRFMNENWEAVFSEVKPAVDQAISTILKSLADKVFEKFTYDELFPK